MFAKIRSSLSLGFIALLIAVILLIGAGAIAQEEDVSDATELDPISIDISMIEYLFLINGEAQTEPLELIAGQPYTLHFDHAGNLEHEVLVGQGVIEIGEGMHRDFEVNMLDDVEVHIEGMMGDNHFMIGVSGLIEFEMYPLQELSLTFTLPDDKIGDWELSCFVFLVEGATEDDPAPTHYDAGMTLPITVVAGS